MATSFPDSSAAEIVIVSIYFSDYPSQCPVTPEVRISQPVEPPIQQTTVAARSAPHSPVKVLLVSSLKLFEMLQAFPAVQTVFDVLSEASPYIDHHMSAVGHVGDSREGPRCLRATKPTRLDRLKAETWEFGRDYFNSESNYLIRPHSADTGVEFD